MRLVQRHTGGVWADDRLHCVESIASISRGGGRVVSTHDVGPDRVQVVTDIGEPLTIVRFAGERQLPRHTAVVVTRLNAGEVRV